MTKSVTHWNHGKRIEGKLMGLFLLVYSSRGHQRFKKDDLELLDQDISKFHEINLRSTVDETQKSEISSCDVLSMPNDEIFPEKEEITLTYIVASSKFSGKN